MSVTRRIFARYGPSVPLFYINGTIFPDGNGNVDVGDFAGRPCTNNPARGYKEATEQLVDSTRNANGQVVSQTINRRLRKFDNLSWSVLTRTEFMWLQQQVAKFTCNLTYYDSQVGGLITRQYYWGDLSAEPFEWECVKDSSSGVYYKRPTAYKNVSVNLIDCGY